MRPPALPVGRSIGPSFCRSEPRRAVGVENSGIGVGGERRVERNGEGMRKRNDVASS